MACQFITGKVIKNKMKENQKIVINVTSEDIEELQSGGRFEWCFPSNKGEKIDVIIFGNDDEEESQEIIEKELAG